jgi:hypothetical protein
MKETLVEYDHSLCGKLRLHVETKPVKHGPESGTRIRYRLESLKGNMREVAHEETVEEV